MFPMLLHKSVQCDLTPCPFLCTDVSIEVPDDLDLTASRGKGKQPNEEELPSDQPAQPGQWMAE